MNNNIPSPNAIAYNKKEIKKVLIIKTGYSETLDPDSSGVVSLGDVLRTTPILHLFPNDEFHVTWLTSPESVVLLKGNDFIQKILKVNAFTPFHLTSEWFDIVINLEKDPGICAMADKIPAWKRYGFRFVPNTDGVNAYDFADEALEIIKDENIKKHQTKSWSELLFGLLGAKYNGEQVILGYKPKTTEKYDVGLNHNVGVKFPFKKWPMERWEELANRLEKDKESVSWQQSANNLEGYIDWINSCKTIITNDSLGLHLALALGKKVIALFGPSSHAEVSRGEGIIKITPDINWDCMPCLADSCHQEVCCMNYISVEKVLKAYKENK
jgi:heptosyltransferase-2